MSSEYDNPQAGPPPAERVGPLGQQLLSQAQAIARLRADLDELAHHSTDTLVDLVDRIDDLESKPRTGGGPPAAWCWRDLGPQATGELWGQLTGWVAWVRGRYPLARRIPDCWAEHPETVEELTALWLAWQAAYTEPNASLTAAADWHDRWLPGVLYRLEHGPFALDCASGHRTRPATAYAEDTNCVHTDMRREQSARAAPREIPTAPHSFEQAGDHSRAAPQPGDTTTDETSERSAYHATRPEENP